MELHQKCMECLKKEGFDPIINENCIEFRVNSSSFFWIHIDKKDELYFDLFAGIRWDFSDEAEIIKALKIANNINVKAVKFRIIGDCVYASVEMFLGNTSDIDKFLKRSIDTIKVALNIFSSDMDNE
ncbi:MAG: hypothetical protein LBT27_02845 [Prevotellaceae bacterium]|jgi:exosortase/archaeosortase|nr:hypothetical protein [Prevotellaceae bacterium]